MLDNAYHILIVDDDARLASLLKQYLSDSKYRTTVAESAEAARKKMEGLSFDLIVLDRMMPGEDGLSMASTLRNSTSENRNIPILMLTAMAESSDRIDGLEAGVDDYLTKPFEPRELLLRIEAILRRSGQETVTNICFGDFEFNITRGELVKNGDVIALTTSEQILLKTLAMTAGVSISRETLSQSSGAQGRAIDVQITRLRRKIEKDPRIPQYLQTVRGEGYVLWAD
ncbi:MAG: response regulator [Sneathiella sp.]|nr:response regulator [Sneathiella sp.]